MAARQAGRWTHRGDRSCADILDLAVEMASSEGIHRVTFGRVAKAAGVSKSGVFEHFGSIEELHEAIVTRAASAFDADVTGPARRVPTGIVALYTLLHRWVTHATIRSGVNGCFLTSVTAESEGRVGRVHDLIAGLSSSWMSALEWELRVAQYLDQIHASEDAEQLAFEFHAVTLEASWSLRYLKRKDAHSRALEAIRSRMDRLLTPKGRQDVASAQADEALWLEREVESVEGDGLDAVLLEELDSEE